MPWHPRRLIRIPAGSLDVAANMILMPEQRFPWRRWVSAIGPRIAGPLAHRYTSSTWNSQRAGRPATTPEGVRGFEWLLSRRHRCKDGKCAPGQAYVECCAGVLPGYICRPTERFTAHFRLALRLRRQGGGVVRRCVLTDISSMVGCWRILLTTIHWPVPGQCPLPRCWILVSLWKRAWSRPCPAVSEAPSVA